MSARVLAMCLVAVGASACADVLGFEPATLDPELGKAERQDASMTPPPRNTTPQSGDSQPGDAGVDQPSIDDAGRTRLDAGPNPVALDAASPDAAAEEPVDARTPCEAYCDVVMEACQNDARGDGHAVYDSYFTCERQCAFFEAGTDGDQQGNTLACRTTHAQAALRFPGERDFECPAAGPGGDGVCGSNCEGYCTLMREECSSDFGSMPACLDECAAAPDLGGFNVSQIDGNSVQCRLYHLGAALVGPLLHCPHAAGAYPCSEAL